jgi:hypothetical protein
LENNRLGDKPLIKRYFEEEIDELGGKKLKVDKQIKEFLEDTLGDRLAYHRFS